MSEIVVTDEAVEAVARGMFGPGWDQQSAETQGVCLLMSRKSLEAALPHLAALEALRPVVVDREAARDQIEDAVRDEFNRFAPAEVFEYSRRTADAVLAALYPKATEGKS